MGVLKLKIQDLQKIKDEAIAQRNQINLNIKKISSDD